MSLKIVTMQEYICNKCSTPLIIGKDTQEKKCRKCKSTDLKLILEFPRGEIG